MITKFIILVLVYFFYRFINNIVLFVRVIILRNDHFKYLELLIAKEESRSESDLSFMDKHCLRESEIVELFTKAGEKDNFTPIMQPAGYGYINQSSFSDYKNMFVFEFNVQDRMRARFRNAIGYYRHQALQSLNPLFWIETILHLPSMAFRYMGWGKESSIAKFLDFVTWIFAAWAFLVSFPDFHGLPSDISKWLHNLLDKIMGMF